MEELDGREMGGSNIEVSLAKPPSDKKKKEEILRARERRMMQMMQVRGGWVKNNTSFLKISSLVLVYDRYVTWHTTLKMSYR